MDIVPVEESIRKIGLGYGHRFPDFCYRCGRTFESALIRAIERGVMTGKPLMQVVKEVCYDRGSGRYLNPGEDGYSPSSPAISPKEICCRMVMVSPISFPCGTVVPSQKIVRKIVPKPSVSVDLFDMFGESSAQVEVTEEHEEVRLYVEPGLEDFPLPIEWDV
jgi:hypothetical protein